MLQSVKLLLPKKLPDCRIKVHYLAVVYAQLSGFQVVIGKL
jgi:hypothetical protein